VEVTIKRITTGPSLSIRFAEDLAPEFMRTDASSKPSGYDDLAGHGEPDQITRSDIVAINTTMRARSSHDVWSTFIEDPRPQSWLRTLDPAWDLIALDDLTWQTRARGAVEVALGAAIGKGRGLSVGTKVLHLKRPMMFPVLDSLVLQQLGATDAVAPMKVVEHLRLEGIRNLSELRQIQSHVSPHFHRSLVRILDILLWATHPAAGLSPGMRG
jgi:hypothetical protein